MLARITVSTRLFIAVLAVSAAAVIAAGIGSHHSFKHGFVGYLNQLAVDGMNQALPRLTVAYQERGSWDFLREQPRLWIRVMLRGLSPDLRDDTAPPESDLTGAFLRMTLLDADRRFVIGYHGSDEGDRIELPVKFGEQTVGWLTLMPFQNVTEMGAKRFAADQLSAHRLIVLLVILFAGLIAWWVSHAVMGPIRQVARATHELAGGNYARRVPEFGKDEVGQLAHDFNHLAATLERNEAMRREFMADIAHELRTPLGILHGELEALEDGIRPFGREALSSLQSEVAQLSKLVTDLNDLALTDVAALAYRKEDMDLMRCVAEVLERIAPRLAQCQLQLQCVLPEQPLPVFADAGRIRQLLHNLLENCCRYTDPGGMVRIQLSVNARRQAVLSCEDSAPGVAVAVLPRLFDRFYRAELSRNRASGGSGLGLAICRNIVLAHDGEIEAAAAELGGIAITIRLPLAPSKT